MSNHNDPSCNNCQNHCPENETIYCDPQTIVHDTYIPRVVTYVHPIVHVNRQNIVDVPRHVYPQSYETVVADTDNAGTGNTGAGGPGAGGFGGGAGGFGGGAGFGNAGWFW
ncbi:spore coat protein D [Pullulanibacillus pueri]|uniref:Spore coat protein D n=1 Tax=Pullulanibacillus pueri TaxID=1437324 RepID=A0A8J3EKM7_9BACL|nr:hypothetical protein [Pullulanibacillus pueri]MBM7680416.1 spore coat protein D [Pullulanibacillus pueri]GGH75195.1 hypothetical protein GCM10007096_04160 [Pullulanibacillus pueri]